MILHLSFKLRKFFQSSWKNYYYLILIWFWKYKKVIQKDFIKMYSRNIYQNLIKN